MSERYGWRFQERRSGSDVVVIGTGRRSFWEKYGEQITIVSWDTETERPSAEILAEKTGEPIETFEADAEHPPLDDLESEIKDRGQ